MECKINFKRKKHLELFSFGHAPASFVFAFHVYMKEWILLSELLMKSKVQSGECMNSMHRSQNVNVHVQEFMPEILARPWNVTLLTRLKQARYYQSLGAAANPYGKKPWQCGFSKLISIMNTFKQTTTPFLPQTTKCVLTIHHSCSCSNLGKATAEKETWSCDERQWAGVWEVPSFVITFLGDLR